MSTCGKENKLYASFLLLAVEKLSELGFQYFIEKFELSIMLYVSILDASMMHWTDAVSPFHYSYLNKRGVRCNLVLFDMWHGLDLDNPEHFHPLSLQLTV